MSRPDRPTRFLPPIAGGAPPTGWEALDKWVKPGESGAAPAAASGGDAPAPSGKTGWEALEKWVGRGAGAASAGDAASGGASPAPSGKTGWEALDKWVGSGGGGAGGAAPAEAGAAPSGKTGWEALDKWVGSGGGAAGEGASGEGGAAEKIGEVVERAVDTVQERAAELKDDLAKIREKLPMEEIETAGKGFFAALKKFFRGK
jgi:hypothetical protein